MFLRDRGSSDEFAEALADRAIDQLPASVDGSLVLDLGCGPGVYSRALARAGAKVISSEIDVDELRRSTGELERPIVADGRQLPLADGSVDAIVCSNVLEHTPEPFSIIDEMARVMAPGGWAYISWTNWLSPWGGHAVAPLHYVGAERSVRWWTRWFGQPKGKNLPLVRVWPTYVGRTLAYIRSHPTIDVVDVYPRYWPRLRFISRIPGLREVASWNCVIVIRPTASTVGRPASSPAGPSSCRRVRRRGQP